MRSIKTAIFPVAGLGSRFLPATKAIPKEMLVVVDKPLIQYAVEEAKAAGIEKFIFVTSQGKTAIEDHFDSHPTLENTLISRGKNRDANKLKELQLEAGQAIFIRQPFPLGLGHAVLCARHFVAEEAFALVLADDLVLSSTSCLEQMVRDYKKSDGNMVAVMDVEKNQVNRYGILKTLSDDGVKVRAEQVVEKPAVEQAPSQTAVIGRYILHKQIFNVLASQKAGVGSEIQITDGIQAMLTDVSLTGYRFQGTRFDCGTKHGWLEANIAFAYNQPDLKDHIVAAFAKIERNSHEG